MKKLKELGISHTSLEYDGEKPMPCPFCGGKCDIDKLFQKGFADIKSFAVYCTQCSYLAKYCHEASETIAKHNRICRAVAAYKENMERDD